MHAVSLLPALSSLILLIPAVGESPNPTRLKAHFSGGFPEFNFAPFLAAGAVMPPRFRERGDRVGFPPPPSPRPATTFAIECTGKKMLEGREKAISVLTEKGFLNGRS